MLLLLPPLKNIQTPIGGLDQLYWFPADKARAAAGEQPLKRKNYVDNHHPLKRLNSSFLKKHIYSNCRKQ
jgi:hypothetical protein